MASAVPLLAIHGSAFFIYATLMKGEGRPASNIMSVILVVSAHLVWNVGAQYAQLHYGAMGVLLAAALTVVLSLGGVVALGPLGRRRVARAI